MTKQKLFDFLTVRKTFIFLLICLAIHFSNVVMFLGMRLYPLASLNFVSAIFYIFILFLFNKNSTKIICASYFEILIFSLLSEIFIRGRLCYVFFTIGMIPMISFLLPFERKYKAAYQFIGIFVAMLTFFLRLKGVVLFDAYDEIVSKYEFVVSSINLSITLLLLFLLSNIYAIEMDSAKMKFVFNSNHDQLTGLLNRQFIMRVVSRINHVGSGTYAVAVIDINDFCNVNDIYGHSAGDMVLRAFGACILEHIPSDFFAVRWSGEEILLIMTDISEEKARSIVEEICDSFYSVGVDVEGNIVRITATAGIEVCDSLGNFEALVASEEEKIAAGKCDGKNCIVS